MTTQPVLSRHRLPHPYRAGLVLLTLTPAMLLAGVLLFSRGTAAIDVRLGVLLAVMCSPALYYWREGVDVLPDGLVTWQFVPQFHAYAQISGWSYQAEPERLVLTLWRTPQQKLAEFRTPHLTDLPVLLDALALHIHRQD